MSGLKKLAQETAIYGVSSILGRFLNWCLVPLYSYVLASSGEYGVVTELYAWVALVVVIITYGMETGFFRFVSSEPNEAESNRVYSTTLTTLASTSILFAVCGVVFSEGIAGLLGYASHPEYIALLSVTVALDAFSSIPFSYLRYKNKAVVFACLKMLNIFVNITMNIFFLVLCPMLHESSPELISWFYDPGYSVGYVFVSNFMSSAIVGLALVRYVFVGKFNFDWGLLKKMLGYSLPLLLLGVAGIMNQTVDKIIFKMIYPDKGQALVELGIYGASFKVAMVMMMFSYAFKFAYEPFVFAKYGKSDCKESYADAMKYYVITALFILLGMVLFKDVLQYVLGPEYRVGLQIIPIVLLTYLLQGIVSNLSLWYKLIDKTMWGALFSVIGLVITIVLNVIFVPIYSYWASAGASLVCFFVMMVLSYVVGQKYYPISYPLKSLGIYALLTGLLIAVAYVVDIDSLFLRLLFRGFLLMVFVVYLIKKDLSLSEIPILRKMVEKKM